VAHFFWPSGADFYSGSSPPFLLFSLQFPIKKGVDFYWGSFLGSTGLDFNSTNKEGLTFLWGWLVESPVDWILTSSPPWELTSHLPGAINRGWLLISHSSEEGGHGRATLLGTWLHKTNSAGSWRKPDVLLRGQVPVGEEKVWPLIWLLSDFPIKY